MNNTVKVILKVVAALAAVAGIVYVIAAYGDKIVAWAKRLLGYDYECEDCFEECECADEIEEAAEEVAAEEAPAAENIVAAESDFEG